MVRRKDWQDAYIEVFATNGRHYETCRNIGVSHATVWRERQRNEEFALAYSEAERMFIERLQAELYRRAVVGVEREVRFQGDVVGHERQFSDALLIFELKKRDPSYRDTTRHEHSGPDGGPITFADLARSVVADEDRDQE